MSRSAASRPTRPTRPTRPDQPGLLRVVLGAARRRLAGPGLAWFLWAVGLVVLGVGWYGPQPGPMLFSVVVLLVACGVCVSRTPRVSYLATVLLAAFTLFLVVRPVLDVVVDYPVGSVDAYGMPFNRDDVYAHVFGSLALSLAGLFVGFAILERLDGGGRRSAPRTHSSDALLPSMRVVSVALLALALPAQALLDVEAALYVADHSYFDLYTSFSTGYPTPVRLLGGMTTVAFLAYLATNPRRRAVWVATSVYLVASLVSVAAGQRTTFILSLAVVAVYVAYRNANDTEPGRWISRRVKVGAVVAMPVLLVGMGLIARMRTLPARRTEGALAPLWETLFSQGVSTEVVGYGFVYRAQVPDGFVWSFGHVLDLLGRRLPGMVGLGPGAISGQTVERAEQSGIFAQLLSWRVLGGEYLKGRGMGSSYVAELWADLSYPGIVLGSLVLGLVVWALTLALHGSWLVRLAALLLMRELVLIPRSGFSQFLVEAFTAPTVLGIVAIGVGGVVMSRWVPVRTPAHARPPAAPTAARRSAPEVVHGTLR